MNAHPSSMTTVAPGIGHSTARQWLGRRWCEVWGHQVDNHRFRREAASANSRAESRTTRGR